MKFVFEDGETLGYGSLAERFVCEPRSASRGGWGTNCWLVVKDMATDKYITYPSRPRKYASFKNSKEAYEWIQEQIKKGDLIL